jgi:hypothetical protein
MIPSPTIKDNVLRMLAHYGLQDSINITRVSPDRVAGWPTSEALRDFLVANKWAVCLDKITSINHGNGHSFREPGAVHPAMQIVLHPDDNSVIWPYWVEIDIDFWSPLGGDLVSLVGHTIEVAHNTIHHDLTDQEKISRLLDVRFS